MCKTSNDAIEELEDLFKYDEMNTITNVDEIHIENYIKSLCSLVKIHIEKETEHKNERVIINNLKKKFPNYLQKCTHKHKCQYKKTTLLFYYKNLFCSIKSKKTNI